MSMNELTYFLEILKFTIAGLLVFFVGWYVVRTYFDQHNNLYALELKKAGQQQILPLRLQAYERVILFL